MNKSRTANIEARVLILGLCLLSLSAKLGAQTATSDSVPNPFQRGGIYDRPYILNLGGKTAIGGYADFNSDYVRADGVTEGFTFEQRRFNVNPRFVSAIAAKSTENDPLGTR